MRVSVCVSVKECVGESERIETLRVRQQGVGLRASVCVSVCECV